MQVFLRVVGLFLILRVIHTGWLQNLTLKRNGYSFGSSELILNMIR